MQQRTGTGYPLYCGDNRRPNIAPVVLVKMVLIQHPYGLPLLRRTADEIAVNVAHRWFLGYTSQGETPYFSTVSYKFLHQFTVETADGIFAWILVEVEQSGDPSAKAVFIDATQTVTKSVTAPDCGLFVKSGHEW